MMAVSPAMHPRMANEQQGPTPTEQLEPPGFMALNYGRRTPITVIVAHLLEAAPWSPTPVAVLVDWHARQLGDQGLGHAADPRVIRRHSRQRQL